MHPAAKVVSLMIEATAKATQEQGARMDKCVRQVPVGDLTMQVMFPRGSSANYLTHNQLGQAIIRLASAGEAEMMERVAELVAQRASRHAAVDSVAAGTSEAVSMHVDDVIARGL